MKKKTFFKNQTQCQVCRPPFKRGGFRQNYGGGSYPAGAKSSKGKEDTEQQDSSLFAGPSGQSKSGGDYEKLKHLGYESHR